MSRTKWYCSWDEFYHRQFFSYGFRSNMELELFFSYSLRSNLELELKNSYKTVTVVTTVTAVTIFRGYHRYLVLNACG